jgi:tyrosyl-tRNA synthetase
MSKSLNNAIGLDEHPLQMFSKLEKVPDQLVNDYITLLTDCNLDQFPENPRERQKRMAVEVVSTFHGREKALKALKDSEALVFSQTIEVNVPEVSTKGVDFPCRLATILKTLNLVESTSEARRKIKAGSVKVDGVGVTDENLTIESVSKGVIVQLSKKDFFKLV